MIKTVKRLNEEEKSKGLSVHLEIERPYFVTPDYLPLIYHPCLSPTPGGTKLPFLLLKAVTIILAAELSSELTDDAESSKVLPRSRARRSPAFDLRPAFRSKLLLLLDKRLLPFMFKRDCCLVSLLDGCA